ncbi:uncharacterized protein LOC142415406 [Mycteria americana]|uniref:uncharacterized protein LOC142415406 n=1 Tax=Mycteria americana TaxID=33587 RepID=UPI003F582196
MGELLAARRCFATAAYGNKALLIIAISCSGLACIARVQWSVSPMLPGPLVSPRLLQDPAASSCTGLQRERRDGPAAARVHAPTELLQGRCSLLVVKLEVASAGVGADSPGHKQQRWVPKSSSTSSECTTSSAPSECLQLVRSPLVPKVTIKVCRHRHRSPSSREVWSWLPGTPRQRQHGVGSRGAFPVAGHRFTKAVLSIGIPALNPCHCDAALWAVSMKTSPWEDIW